MLMTKQHPVHCPYAEYFVRVRCPSPANLINCLVGRNALVWRPDKILKEGGRSDISGYSEIFRGYLGSTKCYQIHEGLGSDWSVATKLVQPM